MSSSNESQSQQQNLTNSIHQKKYYSSQINSDNTIKFESNPIFNQQHSSFTQNKPKEAAPSDWQRNLLERNEFLPQTNHPSNIIITSSQNNNSFYQNPETNGTQAKTVIAPLYADITRNYNNNPYNAKLNNPNNFNNNNFINNSGFSEGYGSSSSNNTNNISCVITSTPGNTLPLQQQSLYLVLDERNKEILNLKETLNILEAENTLNKKLLVNFSEEKTKMLMENNQLKLLHQQLLLQQNKSSVINTNNTTIGNNSDITYTNNSNMVALEAKIKDLEHVNESLKKELSTKENCMQSANEKFEDLQNNIKKTAPYVELSLNFEKLQEERKNLKAYTSELQTLYSDMIEEYKALRPKASEAQSLEKALGAVRIELSSAISDKEALEAKWRELELGSEGAKAKNNALKIEKDSLVETINRLNAEVDKLKIQLESKQNGKLNTDLAFNINHNNENNKHNNNTNNNIINYNNNNNNNYNNNVGNLNANTSAIINDLPELFKLELEEKEKVIQIMHCSLEERERIIEQLKGEQGKMISRNKSSLHNLINTVEDLKFKIINLETEINEKNNFISMHNNEFSSKKLETENLNLENRQLKDQINIIPVLKGEIENLKAQLKKQISQTDEVKEQINSKESKVIMLEKTVSALKNELDDKESQLSLATEECNTTKLYEKKRDIIQLQYE